MTGRANGRTECLRDVPEVRWRLSARGPSWAGVDLNWHAPSRARQRLGQSSTAGELRDVGQISVQVLDAAPNVRLVGGTRDFWCASVGSAVRMVNTSFIDVDLVASQSSGVHDVPAAARSTRSKKTCKERTEQLSRLEPL